MAHDIKQTLIQEGAAHVATCSGAALGAVQVDFFQMKNAKVGFVVFTSNDEDAVSNEHILRASITQSFHDTDIYQGEEMSASLVTVGEGTTPMQLSFGGAPSALKVWLKAYGQGFNLKSAKLECTQL